MFKSKPTSIILYSCSVPTIKEGRYAWVPVPIPLGCHVNEELHGVHCPAVVGVAELSAKSLVSQLGIRLVHNWMYSVSVISPYSIKT